MNTKDITMAINPNEVETTLKKIFNIAIELEIVPSEIPLVDILIKDIQAISIALYTQNETLIDSAIYYLLSTSLKPIDLDVCRKFQTQILELKNEILNSLPINLRYKWL